MALTIHLHIENGELVTCIEGGTGEIRTPFQALPSIESLQADPFRHGQALTRALGGEADLLARLSVDAHNLLLLDCDEAADTIAWEFATCTDGQFLCIKTGLLRTVERDAPPLSGDGMLNFVALAADPLVDADGNPREGYRLDLDNELRAIRVTLQACGKNLEARRIPPTRQALNKALRQGPAVLHLTCHGNVVKTKSGPLAVLSLEKEDGSMDPLTGPDLLTMPPRGVLRMVLLSACMTATGTQANLARALALSGVPLTVGMQNPFPDALSDDLAVALYDYLFAGMPFGEALRQARQNLAQHPQSVGLPVGYVARNGWEAPLPLRAGTPAVGKLTKPGFAALGGEIQPPRPLLGRNRELHQLARLYADGQKVVTVVGTGGMGKTALAAAFAERFAWRWSQGVWAYSFANEVNSIGFTNALLAALFGPETARQMADWPPLQKRAAVLEAAKNWDGLWLLDNYESVMQGLAAQQSEAEQIHRLVSDLANGDTALLLTSREQPAGLRNERLFPQNAALRGLGEAAGAELFLQHSVKAKAAPREHAEFAREIQRAADGHPLAIALLAGEFDLRAVNQADFLGNWEDELADARRAGLADHHVTFLTAFERSFSHLPHDYQRALAALSIFTFPFLAEGAKQIWENLSLFAGTDPKEMPLQALHELTRRSLLEVEGTFTDNSPATWRFQPALRQEASRRMAEADRENQLAGYAAYGDWLAQRAYGEINSDLGLNRLVRLSMEALEQATVRLEGADRLWHIRRLAWLKNAWGETQAAFDLLVGALSIRLPDVTTEQENARIQSAIRFELAGVYNTRGELDRALALYQESLALKEQLGDKKGKAASLGGVANLYMRKGEWDQAVKCLDEALILARALQAIDMVAFNTVKLGQVAQARGDIETASARYHEGLAIFERLRMPEARQVQEMLARLEGGPASADAGRPLRAEDPQLQAVQQARAAHQRGELDSAIQHQEQAVSLARQTGPARDALVKLSIRLFNLAGYYAQADRHAEAVLALEEVVALDERTNHPDLESDRQTLQTAREIASLSPEERTRLRQAASAAQNPNPAPSDFEAQLQAALAQVPPQERAAAEAQIRQALEEFQRLSPAQQAALADAALCQRYEQAADQARLAALAYVRRQAPKQDVVNWLEHSAEQAAEGEAPGSPWLEVAALCLALAALIKGEPIPQVPVQYAAHFSAVQTEMNSR